MNESSLKAAAYVIAEATPMHLDKPTTPPIHWNQEGEVLRVLLADGRSVRGPLHSPKPVQAPAKVSPPSILAKKPVNKK
jgi:hypothetical protein